MSLRQRVASILKYNRAIYALYRPLGSAFLRVVGAFVRTDGKLILFNSFAGRSYGDSPRAIYEEMRNDSRYAGYRLVWAFHDPSKYDVPGMEKIRTDTPRYFLTALAARAWVTNSSVERGLSFRKSGTVMLNTWHGTPLKRMGTDLVEGNESFKSDRSAIPDAMCVQGEYEARIWARAFGIPDERLVRTGLPRNDELARPDQARREEVRRRLNIPSDAVTVLYCPTFREYERDSSEGVVMRPPLDLSLWDQEMGDRYVLLVRAHYEVSRAMEVRGAQSARDVTEYSSLNELMLASDVLVSDYSSVYFDWSITEKPMLHFCYDYDAYSSRRGMYFDIRDWVDGSDSQEGLMSMLRDLDYEAASARTAMFREAYVDYCGNATQQALDVLWQLLNRE